MKKKIVILGSTGSIGRSTVEIIKNDIKNFDVILLTTNNNHNEILKQTKKLKPKNLVINNFKHYINLKKKLKNSGIKIYNNFQNFNKKNKKKVDYTMCAISGLSGLKPTLDAIKFSKNIAIANKESLICGWNLIEKSLKKNNTKFIPVDSEHFSIMNLLNNLGNNEVEKILITASGGPFLNLPLNKFKNIKPNNAIKHPNWKMGKKISIDSSTLMNKVFEVIEAKKIFNIDLKKFKVLIHPKSYIHAIVRLDNGLIKIVAHETDMKIPIFNTLYGNTEKSINTKKINFKKLNNLNLQKPNLNKFPFLRLQKKIPSKISLFETVLVSANDEIVKYYLDGLIEYNQIFPKLLKILNLKKFKSLKNKSPKNLHSINQLNEYVRLKTREVCIR